jgi:hypothetical protein
LLQSNAQKAPELAAKQCIESSGAWLRSLLRCGKATRNKAPEPGSGACCVMAKQRAAKLRSLAPKLAALRQSNTQQASKQEMKKTSYLFVCAPAAPAPQPQLQLHSSSSTAARGLWSSGDGVRGGGVGRW